jgi:hypothetical protein
MKLCITSRRQLRQPSRLQNRSLSGANQSRCTRLRAQAAWRCRCRAIGAASSRSSGACIGFCSRLQRPHAEVTDGCLQATRLKGCSLARDAARGAHRICLSHAQQVARAHIMELQACRLSRLLRKASRGEPALRQQRRWGWELSMRAAPIEQSPALVPWDATGQLSCAHHLQRCFLTRWQRHRLRARCAGTSQTARGPHCAARSRARPRPRQWGWGLRSRRRRAQRL